jgi:hypothetical protein
MRQLVPLLGAVALLGAACDAGSQCDGPGLRYVVHFTSPDRAAPVDTGITYSNGKSDHFGSLVPPTPWPDPFILCFAYGPDAVDGPAGVWFDARPEGTYGSARVVVDVTQLVEVDLDVGQQSSLDAGP